MIGSYKYIFSIQQQTKQNKTKQNKTKQNKTKQSKAKQNKTKQNKTKQNKTKQNKTKNKTKRNESNQSKFNCNFQSCCRRTMLHLIQRFTFAVFNIPIDIIKNEIMACIAQSLGQQVETRSHDSSARLSELHIYLE